MYMFVLVYIMHIALISWPSSSNWYRLIEQPQVHPNLLYGYNENGICAWLMYNTVILPINP